MCEARADVLHEATALEGHADNVAASLYGGVVAVAGGHVVRVPLARELTVVVWVPDRETPTASARRLLPEHVPFEDAVFNVGRTALLVAALAAGDVDALRTATEDRLHQDRRLARVPGFAASRWTRRSTPGRGAHGCRDPGPRWRRSPIPAEADAIAAALPATGRARRLQIDDEGAT